MMNEEIVDDAANAAAPTPKREPVVPHERVAQGHAANPTESKTVKTVRQRKPANKPTTKSDASKSAPAPAYPEPETVGGHEPTGMPRKHHRNHRRKSDSSNPSDLPAPPITRVDAAQLESYAWKIFKGEVVEEGLALMDERAAAETARRAFRVAEIFLSEAAQRRPQQEESSS